MSTEEKLTLVIELLTVVVVKQSQEIKELHQAVEELLNNADFENEE